MIMHAHVTEATRLWLHQAVHYVEQARELAAHRDDFHNASIRVILDHVLRDLGRVAPDIEAELEARVEAEVRAAYPLGQVEEQGSMRRSLDAALAEHDPRQHTLPLAA